MTQKKGKGQKIKVIPDDEPEGSDNPGGNGRSVREAERPHLCQDAEGGR